MFKYISVTVISGIYLVDCYFARQRQCLIFAYLANVSHYICISFAVFVKQHLDKITCRNFCVNCVYKTIKAFLNFFGAIYKKRYPNIMELTVINNS